MKLLKATILLISIWLLAVPVTGQIEFCEVKIVPDNLSGGKITVNLSDMCSNCGPYGGSNGTIDNPPNGATGCAIVKFTEAILVDCVTIGIDPQATEMTDYYYNPLLETEECFMPDGSTSSQGEVFEIRVEDLTLIDGFYDVLICSQSTGNRSYQVTIGCCPSAGEGSEVEVCETANTPIDLFSLLTGEDAGGSWSRLSGTGGTFDDISGTFTPAIGATTSEFEYAAPFDPNSPECNFTSTVTITITPAPVAGSDNSITLCSDDPLTNLYDYLGMEAQASGSWSGPSALDNGFQGTLDPGSDLSGLYRYIVPGTNSCANDTAEIIVTINDTPSAGTDGSLSFCNELAPPMNLAAGLGGAPDPGGSWSPETNTPGVFDPSVDTPGEYTYTVIGVEPCSNASSIVTVTVSSTPDPGEDGEVTLCSTGSPVNLEDYLNGSPDGGGIWSPMLNSGTSVFDPSVDTPGEYTYSFDIQDCETATATVSVTIVDPPTEGTDTEIFLCKTADPVDLYNYIGDPGQDGSWSGPSALQNGYLGTLDPADDAGGMYIYTILGIPPCSNAITTVIVNITESPYAGESNTLQFCISDNEVDLFAALGSDVDKGGTWTPELSSGTNMYMPALDGSDSFTYSIPASGGCPEQSATITTEVYEGYHAGRSGYILVSKEDPPFDLFTVLTMDPDLGGTWDPAPLSGTGLFDPAMDEAGTYTYHVEALGPCDADFANVFVELFEPEPIPTLGTWGMIILTLLVIIVARVFLTQNHLNEAHF